jgi:hypothetical protein
MLSLKSPLRLEAISHGIDPPKAHIVACIFILRTRITQANNQS